MTTPHILALDFDGVLLNGLKEYFQTALRAYGEIWPAPTDVPTEHLAQGFYRLRPVIESGWEMPLLVRALERGVSEQLILQDWSAILAKLVAEEGCDRQQVAQKVDGIRDEWITTNIDAWFSLQEFYPGTLRRLKSALGSPTEVFIVSTKEGRFIHELLQRAAIHFPRDRIFGKEVKQPKYQTLRDIQEQFSASSPDQNSGAHSPSIWFVEDRLKALKLVQQQPDLAHVQLFLATWGYTTTEDRQRAQADDRIHPLTLQQFTAPFELWERLATN